MKTIPELEEELQEAIELCDRLGEHKRRNVGNCPSDLQAYDMAWRKRQALEYQIREAIKAKQDACQHRWEESSFGKKYWAPGTWQHTCRRCGKMSMVQIGEAND